MNYRTLYSRLHRHYIRSEFQDFYCAYCGEENPYGSDHIPSLYYLNENGKVEHGHNKRYKVFYFTLPDGTRGYPTLIPACRKCVQVLSEATDLITFKDRKAFLRSKITSHRTIGEIFSNLSSNLVKSGKIVRDNRKPRNKDNNSFLSSIERNFQDLKKGTKDAGN